MKKLSFNVLLIFLLAGCFLIWACQKGISWGDEKTSEPVSIIGDYGLAAKVNDTAFNGCIDTAYYVTAGSAKTLFIQVTNNAGASFMLGLTSSTGNFSAGTYGSGTNNATIILTDAATNSYTVSGANTSFSFLASTINDTAVAGTFTATLTNASGKVLTITEGQIKGLIGKTNPCGISTPGNTNDSSAVFTLVKGSCSKCATVNVTGTYTSGTDLNATNEAQVDINVTKIGKYAVVTAITNGITFSANGTFTTTGNQTLTLRASGNPVAAGATTIPISVGTSNCSFDVVVL